MKIIDQEGRYIIFNIVPGFSIVAALHDSPPTIQDKEFDLEWKLQDKSVQLYVCGRDYQGDVISPKDLPSEVINEMEAPATALAL